MNSNENLFDLAFTVNPLLKWYDRSARILPWREDPSPYRVCVSEIMLQQTRAEAAKPYFDRFVEALPDFKALSSCGEDRLMKLWEGLGYYSRAKNLQKIARIVTDKYMGRLPASYEALLALPGIGEYTAGAIASIAFSEPVPAVDGNVLRVLSRVLSSNKDIGQAETKAAFRASIEKIIPKDRPGAFNQALMELGATVCIPNGAPQCLLCPLSDKCKGYKDGVAGLLPVKAPKKTRKQEERTVLVLLSGRKVALSKRPSRGLLANLYELPNFGGRLSEEGLTDVLWGLGIIISSVSPLKDAKHVFSHIEWHMNGFLAFAAHSDLPDGWIWADRGMLQNECALPSAFRAYREELNNYL